MTLIQYSGDEIRALNGSFSITRETRKCLFRAKIWKPQTNQIKKTQKTRIYQNKLVFGVLNARSVKSKTLSLNDYITTENFDIFYNFRPTTTVFIMFQGKNE